MILLDYDCFNTLSLEFLHNGILRYLGGTYGSFNHLVMVFINHFQLPIRYDVGLKLLSTLRQDTTTHISNHIQKWRRQRRLIKTPIPLAFLLEGFLNCFHPPISKDVDTSGVSNEEEVIFRSQQLDLIYAQSRMLYHLIPEEPQSNYDPRKKPRPHADGIVGSTNLKSIDLATKSTGGLASSVPSKITQSMDVHSVQLSKNPNGDQQLDGNKRKGQNNCKGGKNGNKPKDKDNNGK
jgi:hypothetical protein